MAAYVGARSGESMRQVEHLADQKPSYRPLTAAEIEAHPEYPHVYWDLKPTKKDSIDVAKGRGGPLKLAYEVHGHGPRKIVVCYSDFMSLGS